MEDFIDRDFVFWRREKEFLLHYDTPNRKIAEEKLYDADGRKDDFLAMSAHELRNPFAPLGAAA